MEHRPLPAQTVTQPQSLEKVEKGISEIKELITTKKKYIPIISTEQKMTIIKLLSKETGDITIYYAVGFPKTDTYATELTDIFTKTHWNVQTDEANFAGFHLGLMISAKEISDKTKLIVSAFNAAGINVSLGILPTMRDGELELKVGSPEMKPSR